MITFDIETTNVDYGSALVDSNEILMICWQLDDGPIQRFTGRFNDAVAFINDYEAATSVCAYNAKFEMLWMKRHGLNIDKAWHDPMLAERVLQGNLQARMGLGDVAGRYGYDLKDPVIDSMMKSGVCPSEMPQDRLMARCVRDVRTTRQLMKEQLSKLKARGQLHIYRTRVDFCVVLAHIESEGMLLDKERVYIEYEKAALEAAKCKEELDELTGGINLRSPDQVAHYLYGKLGFTERKGFNGKPLRNKPSKQFPNGRPKTDKNTMQWLEGQVETKEQEQFIELRQRHGKAHAALTKNLEFFKGVVDERGGTFYAQFNQTVAATHRLTSSGKPIQFKQYPKPKSVQFQNMPRAFKRLFKAPDGYKIVEVDAAQLEFRVAAFLGQDVQALLDIGDPDFDAHCTSAAIMNQIPYEKFLERYKSGDPFYKTLRTAAKSETFKPLFGGTKGTESQERWYSAFQWRYSGIYSQQEAWVAEVAQEKELVLRWGMRFYWPNVAMKNNGVLFDTATKRPAGPQIFNYPVQSLATAEIVPIAITSLYRRCKDADLGVRFINTVHDSVIALVPDAEIEVFNDLSNLAFTTDVYEHLDLHYGLQFNVPLGCGFTPGTFWGEGEETIYDDVTNWKEKAA
jgi:DNA polymerase I-like protein with 3'-5' exonuclease and polymerase domains